MRRVTGNWSELLHEFFDRCGGVAKWQDSLEELNLILDQGTSLLARFDLPSGALPLLRSIADYGEITAEELAQLAASETRETCTRTLEVLELLGYASRGIGEARHLDAVLQRALSSHP